MGVSENGIYVIYVSISDTPGHSGGILFVLFIGYTIPPISPMLTMMIQWIWRYTIFREIQVAIAQMPQILCRGW